MLVALACLRPLAAGGQDLFPHDQLERIRDGLHDIYNLDYGRATANFERMIAESPDDPTGYAYLATTLWLEELSEKQELSIDRFAASDFFAEQARPLFVVDPALEARFRQLTEEAIARSKRRISSAPEDQTGLYLLGLAYQNLASFEASLKRDWWAAFRYGSRAYDCNRELLRRDPQFHDARLATGVYTYVAGSLGWSVKWLALLLGHRGSRGRGKQELELAAQKGQLAAADARVILVLIHTREHSYQQAYDDLAGLSAKYPRNYLLQMDMAGMAMLMRQPDRAIGIYYEILRKRESLAPNYQRLELASLYNRLGVASRAKKDYRDASDWFRRALAEPAVSAHSAALAHLELGRTLDLMDLRAEAIAEYRLAAAAPDFVNTRQEARKLLRPANK